ncbi:MAG TPA: dihydroxyacetone kinase subunit DhaL [Anaerolineaceae bacterium]|nr:dihydroxyacetone kinase subunit DhaL [Anaerolineaceae bacterium]HPR35586.1 dihydroxyacetone kinase subunit DhaL [Anaerolineaceae bacterium]
MAITRDDVLNWIKSYAQAIEENCEMLTDLDREIGDADHGANMRRGFRAVLEKLPSVEDKDIGTILKNVGMTLLSKVGGAAGPLYSTMFTKAGMTIGTKMEMDLNDWAQALEASTTGIAKLGKALPNDKTMLDALYPALNALSAAMGNGASVGEALQKSADAAHEGMLATIPLVARKGRASYLGERSAGHQDPGATSTYLLIKTAAETWTDC